jgi:hypothetical protein
MRSRISPKTPSPPRANFFLLFFVVLFFVILVFVFIIFFAATSRFLAHAGPFFFFFFILIVIIRRRGGAFAADGFFGFLAGPWAAGTGILGRRGAGRGGREDHFASGTFDPFAHELIGNLERPLAHRAFDGGWHET